MNVQMSNNSIGKLISVPIHDSVDDILENLLSTIRTHLDMDVAFISEFRNEKRVFRHLDSKTNHAPIMVGMSDPLEDSYCQRMIDGRLPQLMHDARKNTEAAKLEVTHKLPVGAHISVPIVLGNGEIYGTFCGFSYGPDPSLNQRDLAIMHAFASVAAKQIQHDILERNKKDEIINRIQKVFHNDELSIVYQPIFNLTTMKVVGFESLSRFSGTPARSPDIWFDEANQAGLGIALETKAVQQALQALALFPEHIYLSVNLSPEAIISGCIDNIFRNIPLDRVILEVTEHAAVKHYGELSEAIGNLRKNGLWVAVDDAGAGYASFRHVLNLTPELIKLDISITRDIHLHSGRRALTSAFHGFSAEINCRIVAEGIENELELESLKKLGIKYGQGFLLGKPMPIGDALALCSDS